MPGFSTQISEDCVIHLPEENVDDETRVLAEKMASTEVFNHIRIMPDCHTGSNCCVGMTTEIDDKVIPQIVGGDIGCGITVLKLDKKIKEKQYEKIDTRIKELIPMGTNNHSRPIVGDETMNEIYEKCNIKLEILKDKFPDYDFGNFQYNKNYYKKMVKRVKSYSVPGDYMRSMGTLGGGNHYIEFNVDETGQNFYLSVHCGSRNMGQAICNYHQEKIRQKSTYNKAMFFENVLEGNEMVDYFIDMVFAQEFASKNRAVILEVICDAIGSTYDETKIIESTHNYIDFDKFILRKGAISAEKDKLCIISLNMRDGIIVCRGLGNPEWNHSCAHGCGRLMSRRDARLTFNMREYQTAMEGIYSSCICKDTLDELPQAYKDSQMIKDLISPSVEIVEQLRPIINIKGY